MNNERCETCRYWNNEYGDADDCGVCRRYPPVLHPDNRRDERVAEQPYTLRGDWCGEWQRKEGEG